jgi:hypothetical protein
MSKKDLISFSLFFIFCLFSLSFAQQESITITTYYPSPYGSYKELRAQRIAIGSTYYDSASHPWNEGGTCLANEICNAALVVEGNVGIGTTSPGSYKLNVAGTINTSGGCTGCSDARWKTNIAPISAPLDKIMALTGVQFNWKTKEYPSMFFQEGLDYGLVAQDVEKALPEIVYEDNGYKYIRYDRLSAILIEAAKEQQKEIKEQQKEINDLKEELAQQKAEIASLKEKL